MRDKFRGAMRSLTMWFNAIFGTLLAAIEPIQVAMPQLKDFLGPNIYHYLAAALVIGNIVLRVRTSTSLEDKAK